MAKKQIQLRTVILVLSLLFVVAFAVGVRQLWQEGIFSDSKTPIQARADSPSPSGSKNAGSTQKPPDLSQEDEELLIQYQESMGDNLFDEQSEEPFDENGFSPQEIQPAQEMTSSTNWQDPQMGQGLGGWRNVWSDLNLTEGEMSRLREGWAIAVARWQNMSPEERQFQQERMRASWEKWQNMSDEEKEKASHELRGRFEDWRQSGTTELPDIILD